MNIIASDFPVEGAFRCVLKDKNGNVKKDTGIIKNVVTNNGMYALIGVTDRNSWIASDGRTAEQAAASTTDRLLDYCVVGDGVSVPKENDIKLANIVACTNKEKERSSVTVLEHPTEQNHKGFVKLTSSRTYQFTGIENKNVSEVGLASTITDIGKKYCLLTHANIVDGSGNNTAITVAKDDLFEVTYNFSVYININRTSGTFNLKKVVDGVETTEEYEYICQPHKIRTTHCHGRYSIIDTGGTYLYTYPSLEKDSDVNSSYSLSSLLDGCDYKNIDPVMKKIGYPISITNSRSDNAVLYPMNVDKSFNRISRKLKLWFYSSVAENGIRAWDIGACSLNTYIVDYFIVVKNKANGQGVKKTDKQTWTLEHSISFSRMPK